MHDRLAVDRRPQPPQMLVWSPDTGKFIAAEERRDLPAVPVVSHVTEPPFAYRLYWCSDCERYTAALDDHRCAR